MWITGGAPAAAASRLRAPGWRALTFAIVVAALALHAGISSCDHDEIEHLHAAWLVAQGERPFIDFLEHHSPVLWFLLAPLTRLFAEHVQALVLCCRLVNLFAAAVALKAIDRASPALERSGLASLLLLGSWFHLRNSLEIRPDALMAACTACGLSIWLRDLREGSKRDALLAGLLFGLAMVLLQKAAAFVFLLLLGSALAALRDRSLYKFLRSAGWLSLAAALPVLLMVACIVRAGFWHDYYFWNFPFNRFAYLQANLQAVSPWETLGVAAGEQPILWGLGLFAGVSAWSQWLQAEPVPARELVCSTLVLGMLAAFTQTAFPYSHNLLMIGPPLALLAAERIGKLGKRVQQILQFGAAALVVKCLVLCFVYQENPGHREVQDWLLAHTRPDAIVYAPPPYNPIFRRDPSYFWFDTRLKEKLLTELCKTPACAALLARDQLDWQRHPPQFVYLPPGDLSCAPADWQQLQPRYSEQAELPGLFLLSEKALVRRDSH